MDDSLALFFFNPSYMSLERPLDGGATTSEPSTRAAARHRCPALTATSNGKRNSALHSNLTPLPKHVFHAIEIHIPGPAVATRRL